MRRVYTMENKSMRVDNIYELIIKSKRIYQKLLITGETALLNKLSLHQLHIQGSPASPCGHDASVFVYVKHSMVNV